MSQDELTGMSESGFTSFDRSQVKHSKPRQGGAKMHTSMTSDSGVETRQPRSSKLKKNRQPRGSTQHSNAKNSLEHTKNVSIERVENELPEQKVVFTSPKEADLKEAEEVKEMPSNENGEKQENFESEAVKKPKQARPRDSSKNDEPRKSTKKIERKQKP